MRLAVVTSHPVQYNAPIFKLLSARGKVQIKVFYTWSQTEKGGVYDPGFAKKVEWDIPLLDGYDYEFVENVSKYPGSHHFKGIINPSLNKEIESWQPDALLVFGWSFVSHLKCLRYFHKKVPILFRGDSTLLNEQTGFRKILRRIFLVWVYGKVDYAMVVGTNNQNYYLKHGLKKKQLWFTPHAIDNSRFSGKKDIYSTAAQEWRKKLSIATDDLVFLYAGKLEPVKNPELLIEAFAQARQPKVHLIMVGNGVKEKEIKHKYAEVENLHFIDFQNQSKMPVIYHLCNVFVLPSRSETWGLAINEAMACNRAVLVSNKCGAAIDLVKNGVNGYIFESQNKEDLAIKMGKLIEEKGRLKAMGENSYKIIEEFSFEKICDQIENLLFNKIKRS